MSVATVTARIAQIEGLTAPQPAPAGSPATTGTNFQAQLAAASSAAPAAQAAPVAGAGGSSPYDAEINNAAARYGIDPALLRGLVRAESGFNPNARSSAGALGLTQLMPSTAAGLGVTNPLDPAQSIDGGARYLKAQLDAFGGDPAKALAAFNAGPGAVRQYGGVPPYGETQAYVSKILGWVSQEHAGSGTATLPSTSTPYSTL